MMQLEIKPQPRLSVRELLGMTLTAQRYRIFRSSVTILVVTVATAFLVNLVLTSLISREMGESTLSSLSADRQASELVSQLTREWTVEAVLKELALADREHSGASVWPDSGKALLPRESARRAVQYIERVQDLSLRLLQESGMGPGYSAFFSASIGILERSGIESLKAELEVLGARLNVGDYAAFLGEWIAIQQMAGQIADDRNTVVANLENTFSETDPLAFFASGAESIREQLTHAGADPSSLDLDALVDSARFQLEVSEFEQAFSRPASRRVIAGMLDERLEDVDPTEAWSLFVERANLETFNRLLISLEAEEEALDIGAVLEVAERASSTRKREAILRKIEAGGLASDDASFRLVLLLGISLLVCAVGVANALLMSVTERSREIATLKCLGALDGSILALFVLEASFIGFAGGVLGSILGLVLSGVRLAGAYGTYVFAFAGLKLVLLSGLGSIILGVILSTCASVYPSLRAARLAPMEAMRVE